MRLTDGREQNTIPRLPCDFGRIQWELVVTSLKNRRYQCALDQITHRDIAIGFSSRLRLWYNLKQETQIPEPTFRQVEKVREFALRRASRRVLYVLPVGY